MKAFMWFEQSYTRTMVFRDLSKNNEKQTIGVMKVVPYEVYIDQEKIDV